MRQDKSGLEGTGTDGCGPANPACVWPTARGLHPHGNKACECMSVSVSIRAVQTERQPRVTGCWYWIEFWQVAPSKGPAGSLEDVLPQTWTPELISSRSNQFYGCLHWFHFFWKCTGVNAQEWRAMNTKSCVEFLAQQQWPTSYIQMRQ